MLKPEVRRRSFSLAGFEVLVRQRGSRFHTDTRCPRLLRTRWDDPHQIVSLGDAIESDYAPCPCVAGGVHTEKPAPPAVEKPAPRSMTTRSVSLPDAGENRDLIGREVRIRTGGTRFHLDPSCSRLLRSESDFRHEIIDFDEALAARYVPCPCYFVCDLLVTFTPHWAQTPMGVSISGVPLAHIPLPDFRYRRPSVLAVS